MNFKQGEFLKRAWAEIDLDALKNNFENLRARVLSGVKIMAVVKADAYGHGAQRCSRVLELIGADYFAVSNIEEALELRKCGIEKPVLILGYTPPQYAPTLALNDISQAVYSLEYARLLSEEAIKNFLTVNVHIKIDTGMSRIGFLYHDTETDSGSLDEIMEALSLPGLYSEGIFTHFARADEKSGEAYTRIQFELFTTAVGILEKRGASFDVRHCCNSAAMLDYPEMHLDMVRAGISLYGLKPSDEIKNNIPLSPVMQLKSVISQVKFLEEGTPVSYGGTFVTDKTTKIATVAIGYGDGYSRRLSSKAYMTVDGKKANVLGRVCMDQTLIDVTGIENVSAMQTVTVFGKKPAESADDLARIIGTINYEIVCDVGKRVPRVYVGETSL